MHFIYNKFFFTCMNKMKMEENFQLELCFQVKNEPPYIHIGWKKVL